MKRECESKRKLLETAMEMIWESSYGSVSVDDICSRSGVNKGSFYYFFKSKSDLAVAAIERYWEQKKPLMDKMFSSQTLPLQRLDNYCQAIIKDQKTKYQSFGKLLGCPVSSVGCELSTQDEKVRRKVEEVSQRVIKFHESLVQDLAKSGLIEVRDVTELARELQSYMTGVLMQAKIENSVDHVERLQHGVMRLLGIKQISVAAP